MSFFESLLVVKEQSIINLCGMPRIEIKGLKISSAGLCETSAALCG
jgi:hypothetical protein